MFKWLSGGTKSEVTKPVEYEDLANQPLNVIEGTIKSFSSQPAAFTVNTAQAISRRLIEIACFDENVDVEERKRALALEAVLWKSVESTLSSNQDALKVRREAREAHLEYARAAGVFSLMHKISNIPAERVVSEIVSLKNASLLPNFPKEPLTEQLGEIIRELLRDRAQSQITEDWIKSDNCAVSSLKTANAIVTAGWLVLIRDPTALWAFASDGCLELGKFLDDYDRARSKLITLGAIRPSQRTITLSAPAPEPRVIHDLILQSSTDGTTRDAASNAERYHTRLENISQDARATFMSVIFGLRVLIWKKILASAYGSSYTNTVLSANPDARWVESVQPLLTKLEHLYDVALIGDSNATGFHNLIVAAETLDFVDRSLPESVQNSLVQGFADIFSTELFQFPHYVRYLLRFAIYGQADVTAAMTEDALES